MKLETLIIRRSICPTCLGDGEPWCQCDGHGTIDTPPGERPDAIAVIRPAKACGKGEVAFDIQLIVEPAP